MKHTGIASGLSETGDVNIESAPVSNLPLKNMKNAFHGGRFYYEINEDFSGLSRKNDVINGDVLDAWYSPSPEVLNAISGSLEWLVRSSPPTHGDGLKSAVSDTRGIPVESIGIGAGSSELIFRILLGVILKSRSKILIPDPI